MSDRCHANKFAFTKRKVMHTIFYLWVMHSISAVNLVVVLVERNKP